MTQEEAKRLLAKHGSLAKAAAAAGCSKSTIWDWVHGVCGRGASGVHPAQPQAVIGKHVKARSLAEFKTTFDKDTIVPARIKAGLKSIGAMGWAYEVEFCRIAGLTATDLGNYRDQFADLVVTIKERRAWAGSKAMADKMRAML